MALIDKYEVFRKNVNFIKKYEKALNAASGSEVDANSNVSNKNIATMAPEVHKKDNIYTNRLWMHDKLTEMYGEEIADEYLRQLETHEIYRHDESGMPVGTPYCASITLYPFLFDGMTKIGGTTTAPHHLKSFIGGFINLVFAVSAQLCGAVATPEFLSYMDYFIRKEYGDQYYMNPDKVIDIKGQTLGELIDDYFAQVVYSINQPAAARGSQSCFWNIAYFDRPYFEQLFDDFRFPDGTTMKWESVNWLQKRFMKWFNRERLKNLLTFPVESLSLLNDGKDFVDKEWADFAAEMYAEGHSFFTYTSDSVDSLASCCFSPDTKIVAKSSDGVHFITIKEMYDMKWRDKRNFTVFHNGNWISAKPVKLKARQMYRLTTANKKSFDVTDNHLWPTLDGLKRTDELTTDDYLMFNIRQLDSVKEKDRKLTYEQGLLIGMYLGDGSTEDKHATPTIHYSLNENKYLSLIDAMNKGLGHCGIDKTFTLHQPYNNVYPVALYSQELYDFIFEYVSGRYANEKHLSPDVLLQSIDFRRGILDGFYATDGGNSNRIYTTSYQLAQDMELLCTSLGIVTVIDVFDRTDEPVVIRNNIYKRNYPLYCIRWYNPKGKRQREDLFRIVNNSIYFKVAGVQQIDTDYEDVYCFECTDQTEPYFTLPSGVITHNCRLRNGIQDNQFSYTLGAGGVSTGSKCVMTMNLNRLVQNAVNANGGVREWNQSNKEAIQKAIEVQVGKLHKYLTAFNQIVLEMKDNHMISIYDAGFISPQKQYLTCGVNGLVCGAEFLGIEISNNEAYRDYVNSIMSVIFRMNKEAKTNDIMFNTEMVPAENLGVKHANWDKKDGYFVPRDCYNSYFYIVEDPNTNILDKFQLHGKEFTGQLDGGSAIHANLEEHLTKDQYANILRYAVKTGCNYFTFNIPNSICNDCGHIEKHRFEKCPKCGSENVDYATRVIGYLVRVSKWSKERQEEAKKRYYAPGV